MPAKPKNMRQVKLSATCDRILKHFFLTANTKTLHDRDWRLFNEFIRCNRYRISSSDLKHLLVERGFSDRYAHEIICTYEFLRMLSRLRTPAEILQLHQLKNQQA